MGNGWLDEVAAPMRRWALTIPLAIGTFCLCAVETYERGSFDPVGVPYQAALMAALLFVPGVMLLRLVHTNVCWALSAVVLSAVPVIGLVRTVQSAGAGIDAFRPFLLTVLVLGIGTAIVAVCAEVVLRPEDHPLARRLAREAAGGESDPRAFWRAED